MNQAEKLALVRAVETALAEDLAYGPDVTTEATIPVDAMATAEVTPRGNGILAGVDSARIAFDAVRPDAIEILESASDGSRLVAGKPAMVARGPVRVLLTAERTLLNVISHLSGIATLTAAWVDAVHGTGCAIRDSRKTLPGLRLLERWAVRRGGGSNFRLGLGDAILVKDNHIAAAGSVDAALDAARAYAPGLPCEIEVDTLDQLDDALKAGASLVLLDNFTVRDCAEAVRRVRASGLGTRLEASGGLTLEVARAYAETGVDFLAVGSLTHSAPALDLGLDLHP